MASTSADTPAAAAPPASVDKDPRPIFLENILFNVDKGHDGSTKIKVSGDLSVKNLAPEKSIHLHYTINAWEDKLYAKANWHANVTETGREQWKFSFHLPTEDGLYEKKNEANLEFVVQYAPTGHGEIYDNNGGSNYCYNVKRPNPCNNRWDSVRVASYTWEPLEKKIMAVLAVPKGKEDGHIFVRYTLDFWKSTHDMELDDAYLGDKTKYLTFKFQLKDANIFEFVACNKLVGAPDYWDNNGGRNYGVFPGRVLVQKPKPKPVVKEEKKDAGETSKDKKAAEK
eukprot:comp28547_c0_seq1/m.47200 comp28547_c0_seq1/g.47200  ORF comp28547_c0_seq1/g.47200 comp28547_c0_seq1/m.47200 type:complete len:284 (-) comp28547_c0_seq1:777-1628(-)